MNRKLRLLVTEECPNKCPMCCNNSWDFSSLPVVDRWNYEEIMFTGGEPLLFVRALCRLAECIRYLASAAGMTPRLYLYTSIGDWDKLNTVLYYVDGVVVTPHNRKDAEEFREFNNLVNACSILANSSFKGKSLRLNLFPDIKEYLKGEDLSLWQVKEMHWIKDCPVPEGEDFRRINELWRT